MYEEQKREAYCKTPQRLHDYGASDRAKELVQKSMAIDTLFSGVVPIQWTKPSAPEFHDEMDRLMAAGFKAIGACPSADAANTSFSGAIKSLEKGYSEEDYGKVIGGNVYRLFSQVWK